ncbi:hypothetical protein [Trinickia symbiotica]|nr:hypothetical protein [Trinickia symbiotica]
MKFIRPFIIAVGAPLLIAGPLAMAQNNDTQSGQDQNSGQSSQSGQQAPGATVRYADPNDKASSTKGTLMQRREQGMSPQGGASSGNATGKIPQ